MVYTTKSQDDVINDMILNILDNVTNINDANVGSVFRQHIEAIAQEIKLLYNVMDEIYASTRIDTATTTDLDQLGLLVGKTRTVGIAATGYITCKRTGPATSNFSIAAGGIVGSQPNTGDEQLKFSINAATTFKASISGEQHTFIPGTWDYDLDERFITNTSAITITGYATSETIAYTFNNGSDFQTVHNYNDFLIDVNTVNLMEECESTSGITKNSDATDLDLSTTRKQGMFSWSMGKSGTSGNNAYYYKTITSTNLTDKWISFYVEMASSTIRDTIEYIDIYLGNGGITNSYQFRLSNSSFKTTNWGRYRFRYNDATTIVNGNPDRTSIDYLRVNIVTYNNSDTLTSGDVKFDYLISSETNDYYGDIIQWLETTSPYTSTIFSVSYVPLSKEVPVTAEAIGSKYNVGINKITYRVTEIPNINSVNNYKSFTTGVDEESDDNFRDRIKNAAQSQGKATAEAIRQAVLSIPGVSSCVVEDMPKISTTSEIHQYSSGVSIYQLDHEVIWHDATPPTNISVTGTASSTSHTFLYGTDYISLTSSDIRLSQLQWQTGGTSPDDGTYFYADYTYEWLGHVYIYLSSPQGTPTTSLISTVTTEADATRAAGVTIHVISPTTIYQPVTATIKALIGYTFTDLQDDIEDAITNYINSLGIGEDVYVAKIYDVIMDITGIENSNITVPASDTTITTTQIARVGTITLSSM